jgi:transcriptional regulator of acetoin/glycerol metabolism
VRELLAVVESAAIRSEGEAIGVEHLPPELREAASNLAVLGENRYRAPDLGSDEREAIRSALEATDHHRERAARMLGMSRTTLWRRIKEYGLDGG